MSFSEAMTLEPAHPVASGLGALHGDPAELEAKVRFLRNPSSYLQATEEVAVKETHMSWVFLVGDRVFKLKKPVLYPYLDFTTLEARERYCREEARLNSRLAPGIYRGVVPLKRTSTGALTLDGEGEVVDWLVEMQRLPAELMLDTLLKSDKVSERDVERLAQVLANFYQDAEHPSVDPEVSFRRFMGEMAENRAILLYPRLLSDHAEISALLDRVEAALQKAKDDLRARAEAGHIVDGHGDLRPEHICLTDPVVIFDCLEFNRDLRLVDPMDELTFLGMECARLGTGWFGHALSARVAELMGETVPGHLIAVYSALHATLRARLSLAHLLDPVPREPQKWVPLAQQYLALAKDALVALP